MTARKSWILGALVLLQSSVWATFHEMQIEMLIGGVDGDTTAQAIQLRLREAGNNFVVGTSLVAWGPDGSPASRIVLATFSTNVSAGNQGSRILICTQSFANHVSGTLTPDLLFSPNVTIPESYLAGGRITFEGESQILWSVAFGNYTGTNTGTLDNDVDGNFGAPFAGPLPSSNRKALQFTGAADAKSTQNNLQYALTAGDAVFTNNAGTNFPLTGIHPVAANTGPVCANTQLFVFATAVNGANEPADYAWTAPDASTVMGRIVNLPSATSTHAGTWTLVVTVGGSPLPSSSTTVVVNAVPSTTASANSNTLCEGDTLNLYATNVAGGSFSWTGPGGFVSTMQNPSVTNMTAAKAGAYKVTVTTNSCTSAQSTVNISVNARPATPSASSNSPVCEGQTLNLMTPTVTGATYSWTGPLGFTSSLQNPSITNVTSARSGAYNVTVTTGGCASLAGTVNVIVPSAVSFTASNDGPVCEGGTLNLSVSPAADSYLWSGPNGFVSTMRNPVITDISTGAAGMYSVVATVSGCPMVAANTTVTITARPSAPVASNNGPILEGGSLQLNASTITNATYSWTGPGGYTSNLQNPLITSVNGNNVGIYSVVATVNGCPSLAATTTPVVTLTPPLITTGPSATPNPAIVATPVQFSAAAEGVQPLNFNWDFNDGSTGTGASVSHSFSPAGNYSVKVTVTDARNLTSTASVTLLVDPALVGGNGSTPGEVDSDGDGFTDALETAFGSLPGSISSTPFGSAAAGTPETLSVSKMSIKLNFAKSGSDAISASGILPVPADFSVSGKQVVADVGGVVRTFTLSAKGASPSGSAEAFKISVKAKKGVVAAQDSKWTLKISKGSFATALSGEGLTGDSDAKDKAVSVPVTLLFNQKYFTTLRSQLYSAKALKSGKTKDVK